MPQSNEVPTAQTELEQLSVLGSGQPATGLPGDAGGLTQGGKVSRTVGGKATVRVFGIEGSGSKFVYVFDRSISMQGAPLRAAKRQLVASLASLDSVHQFQIIFFNHLPQAWDLTGGQERIAFATEANKRLAEKFVRGISASGGTYRLVALQRALRLRPDVVFFLTDTDDPMLPTDVVNSIRLAARSGAIIHTIEFGVGSSSKMGNFLTRLASGTGGEYVYVDTGELQP